MRRKFSRGSSIHGEFTSTIWNICLYFFFIFGASPVPFLSWQSTTEAAKILALFAHPSESHFAIMSTVMTELSRRQHNVTVISSHRLNEDIENLEEVIIEPEYPFWTELQSNANIKDGLNGFTKLSDSDLQDALAATGAASTEYFLKHNYLQQLMNVPLTKFDYDLIIIDLFYTEALLMFAELFNKPVIALIGSNFGHYMTRSVESMMPVACSPIDYEEFNQGSYPGFSLRLTNIRKCLARRRQFWHTNTAAQQELINKYFNRAKGESRVPTVNELQSNIALLFLNNYVPLAKPRPLLQNFISVGGLHVRRPRELPWHLRRFLDEARSGVIYINLGNEFRCQQIPKTSVTILFNVLRRRKEHIIWNCHDVENFHDMPANLMIQHLVPQTDILAHPLVKLFIMNGDLTNLQEGILRHVPMLGIPIFEEEHENMGRAVAMGIAFKLDYVNFTEASLDWAVERVLKDPHYPVTIRKVAAMFRNRPLGALEATMFWIDYVLRYKGAPHIRAPNQDNNLSHLHLSDLFISYFVMTLIIVGTLVALIFGAHFWWKRRQIQKIYSKLN